MNKKKFYLSDTGSSLIEIMVSISVVTLSIVFFLDSYLHIKRGATFSENAIQRDELAVEIIDNLSFYTQCNKTIRSALGNGAIANTFNADIPPGPFMDHYSETLKVDLDRVNLTYALDSAAAMDNQRGSTYNSYSGELTFYFKPKVDGDKKIDLRPAKTSITIHDENGTKNWSDVTCSTGLAEISADVGEMCALYGGTLIDSLHCDFNRQLRRNIALPVNNIPTENVSSNRVKRVSLSDVLCYVDTIVTLIPDQDYNTAGTRDYNKDYYRKDYVTRFCKKPGRVPRAAKVNMNVVLRTISNDIKPLLGDIN